jgi:branched-chain amino acid transport system ATP-binding protein
VTEIIRFEGLTKRFGDLAAVAGVGYHIQAGQTTGIIGPNGSGKTTLFNLLSGFFAPTQGSIHFLGKDVTKTSAHQRVDMGMARTFQLVSVFNSLSVWENLVLSSIRFRSGEVKSWRFFLKSSHEERIAADCRAALEWVGLSSRENTPTEELSYGDKRMLEIAMALSLRPKMLLLDEPLAGLSEHEITKVLDLIRALQDRFTLLIIEHKISKIVDLVKRLCVMNEGRLIREGLPEEVLADPLVRECYWGKDSGPC